MTSIRIIYVSKKHNGGYGDRLIGMASAITIARLLNAEFFFHWEPEFMELCQDTAAKCTTLPSIDETLNLVNQHHSSVLENENLREHWAGKTIAISANIPCDIHLWKNPYFKEFLAAKSYENESIQSFRSIFRDYIHLSHPLFSVTENQSFDCGIQIRCGDTYCMPHSLAEQYIPESKFQVFALKLKEYLKHCGIYGQIYITCDTYHMYKQFTDLNDESYTFHFRDRKDDIHFDFWNSKNRYAEVLVDHILLMRCKQVIACLRSNFGTTGAYCSSFCSTIHFYSSDWSEPVCIQMATFDTSSTLVLKEYKDKYSSKEDIVSFMEI